MATEELDGKGIDNKGTRAAAVAVIEGVGNKGVAAAAEAEAEDAGTDATGKGLADDMADSAKGEDTTGFLLVLC